jgi:protein phosphatase PTC7
MIVSGSDGFFDNIFDQEILDVISESPGIDEAGKSLTFATADVKHVSIPSNPSKNIDVFTAKALAELARKHSVDVRFDSPYSMEARSRVRNKYIFSVSVVTLYQFLQLVS